MVSANYLCIPKCETMMKPQISHLLKSGHELLFFLCSIFLKYIAEIAWVIGTQITVIGEENKNIQTILKQNSKKWSKSEDVFLYTSISTKTFQQGSIYEGRQFIFCCLLLPIIKKH